MKISFLISGFPHPFSNERNARIGDSNLFLDRNIMESASMVAVALNPGYMQKFSPSISETAEEKVEKEKVKSDNSPTLDAPVGRRRPALQCHKCKHCASPDCAK